ncbi:MAG: hypothetical protein CVV02_16235 [Firmicutes bacterium HGW-Firmicutes-7]|nr:MAG: hypothetical protein CVV02_16235 [Firmicutes bacterium HGW-Firmicutes-7]
MGKIKFKGLFCFVVGVLTGIIIGAAALCILVSYRIDMYHQEIAYLESTIEDKDARLEKLEKTINTQNVILKDIEIILIFEGDEIDKIEIEKTINEKYTSLLGKEVKNFDIDIISEVVDKRILHIEDRKYRLYVEKLVLTEVLQIWIKVELSS